MRNALVIVAGALVLLIVLNTMGINSTAYFATACAAVGSAAGWLTARRSSGFACALGASLMWFAEVLARSWVDGDLARTFPDCDPCGVSGYATRMTIVTLMGLATFGVVAAAFGWLGAFA